MKLKPINDKIVIKIINESEEKRTESGLILPDTANQGGILEAEVIAVSDGLYSMNGTQIPMIVEIGNKVLLGKHHGGQEYKLNNEDVVIISQNDILSIVEE